MVPENVIVPSNSEHVLTKLTPPRYASWQAAVKDAVRDPRELCRLLHLPPYFEEEAVRSNCDFPVFAPRGFIARMQIGDPHDPLLRQVLPLAEERKAVPGYENDPLSEVLSSEAAATMHPGLLHKYQGRVLIVTTGACAVHCRYCFRRYFPYADVPTSPVTWRKAVDSIASDETLQEVILSGGDPLSHVDENLSELVDRLSTIPHLRRLRVHTRFPIMIPERVTDSLLHLLTGSKLVPIVVIHANHAAELDAAVGNAIARLVEAGVVVLNQAVLLAGVNDSLAALHALCEQLVNLRVIPYYLHQLDRVTGAAHFEVPIEKGVQLIDELRKCLPGYAVPRYVQEVSGRSNKVVLA